MSARAHTSVALGQHLGAGSAIVVVGKVGRFSGAAFDRDGETQLDELHHDLGNGRHAFFTSEGFLWNSDQQTHGFDSSID
jgi:hypothetical protein